MANTWFVGPLAAASVLALTSLLPAPARAQATAAAYPGMAPAEQYLMTPSDEIAMARTAAPPAITDSAEILTLGAHGYERAVAGRNGFVCLVERSWDNDFDHPEFWNPRVRGPDCFNAAAARSVLPVYLQRAEWVLAGVSKARMVERTKAALAAGRIRAPAAGAMAYMLSKDGYLGDVAGGPWHPHLMFFVPTSAPGAWGANVHGSPVITQPGGLLPISTFFVVVPRWSDGTTDSLPR